MVSSVQLALLVLFSESVIVLKGLYYEPFDFVDGLFMGLIIGFYSGVELAIWVLTKKEVDKK